jgi:hypothetical protein
MTRDNNEFRDIFNVAISSEVQENTQQIPKNKKEQLVMYWKSIALLAAENVLTPTQVKEIVMKYSLTDPTPMEVLAKIMLAQVTLMKPETTITVTNNTTALPMSAHERKPQNIEHMFMTKALKGYASQYGKHN